MSLRGEVPVDSEMESSTSRLVESVNANDKGGNCVSVTVGSSLNLFSGMEITKTQSRRRAAAERKGPSRFSPAEFSVSETLQSDLTSSDMKVVAMKPTGTSRNEASAYRCEVGIGETGGMAERPATTPNALRSWCAAEDTPPTEDAVVPAVITSVVSDRGLSSLHDEERLDGDALPGGTSNSLPKSNFRFISREVPQHQNTLKSSEVSGNNDAHDDADATVPALLGTAPASRIVFQLCPEKGTEVVDVAAPASGDLPAHELDETPPHEKVDGGSHHLDYASQDCITSRNQDISTSNSMRREENDYSSLQVFTSPQGHKSSSSSQISIPSEKWQRTSAMRQTEAADNRNPWEKRWDDRRQEVGEAEHKILLTVQHIAGILCEICASVEERCRAVPEITKVEERIEQCIADESFDVAEALNGELLQLSHRIATLDGETRGSFIPFLNSRCGELQSAIECFAQILRKHYEEVVNLKDADNGEIQVFINKSTERLDGKLSDITSRMERAMEKKRNAQRKVDEIRERKDGIMIILQQQNNEISVAQKRLVEEVVETEEEIAKLEAQLEELKRLRTKKEEMIQEMEKQLTCSLNEYRVLEGELHKLLAREEMCVDSASEEMRDILAELELCRNERINFEAKKELILGKWESEASTVNSHKQRCVLLETEALSCVRDYIFSLTELLQLRDTCIGLLWRAPRVTNSCPSAATRSSASLLADEQVKFDEFEADIETSETLYKSLCIQLTEKRSSLQLMEAMKQAAVLARQFKEAQARANEMRELTKDVEGIEKKLEDVKRKLGSTDSKCGESNGVPGGKESKVEAEVQEYIGKYNTLISTTENNAVALVSVLQDTVTGESALGVTSLSSATVQLIVALKTELECVATVSPLKQDSPPRSLMTEPPRKFPPDDASQKRDDEHDQKFNTPRSDDSDTSDSNCIRAELGEMNEIESRCPQCGENGTTRLIITNIPHFKEVIVSSFECPHCGERNNEVAFGGEFGPKSVKYELQVKSKKDLDRQVVKSEYAAIYIPELELEIPRESQRGVLNTVEGFLEQTESGLQLQQPLRRIQHPDLYEKLEEFCEKLRQYRMGDIPFTFIIDDPAGNSYIEAYYDYYHPTIDPQLTRYEKERTDIDRQLLGLTIEYNTRRTDAEQREVQEGQFEDVVRMETECSACKKPGFINIQQVNIPYFKETVIMAFRCDFCGYKTNEVKSGGAVAEKGLKVTLEVKSESDLKRDVLKSDSATLLIPEVALELAPGTLGGFFSTVEGTLMMIRDQLKSLPQAQFAKGDAAATDPESKTLTSFVEELEQLMEVKRPFTFILDDPLANVYIQNPREHLPPPENEDPQLTKTYYTRTFEQDEELGFHQMNVD